MGPCCPTLAGKSTELVFLRKKKSLLKMKTYLRYTLYFKNGSAVLFFKDESKKKDDQLNRIIVV